MKKVLTFGAALVLLMFLSASMLVAQEKAAGHKEKASREMEKASGQKEMKLTDEQKAKIEDMRADLRLKLIDLRAEREKLAIMLGKEMKKPEPSMEEIQGIVKKLSDARERTQLAAIEHALAMRKLLGPEWRTFMRGRLREYRTMMEREGGPGMAGEREEKDIMIMRGPMRGMRGMGERGPMMMQRRGMGEEPAMGEEGGMGGGGAMGEMKGSCMMMQKGAMGEMKGGCTTMEKGGACCSNRHGNWNRMMFRPNGKRPGCCGMGGCMMHKGDMEGMKAGCGADSGQGTCKVKVNVIKVEKKE